MARPKWVRPKHQDRSRTRAMRGDPPRPKVAGQIIRVNEKDARGRVFSEEALRQMAERNPKQLVYDEAEKALLLRAFKAS